MAKKKFRELVANKIIFEWPIKKVEQLDTAAQLSVITKAPEKYVLIDMETGQVYKGSNEPNPYMSGFSLWIEQKL